MPSKVKPRVARRRKSRQPHAWPVGCGIDVVELARFRNAVKRWGKMFLGRVYTDAELASARRRQDSTAYLAARFAAKEAVVKAMAQVDPDHPLTLRHIEIRNDELGRPSVNLKGVSKNQPTVHISLSHAEHIAIASAIVSR